MKLIVKTLEKVERFNSVEDYVNRIKAKQGFDKYPEFMEELNDDYYYFVKPKVKELKK